MSAGRGVAGTRRSHPRLHHRGGTPGSFLQELFKVNNEHRMVTSRLLFACSYWLSGTIDFAMVARVGIATIVVMCVLLVASAGKPGRRLLLGMLLASLIFQLEHYENFLWSGSSIDHFQVMLLVVDDGEPCFIMTDQHLSVPGGARPLPRLASQ